MPGPAEDGARRPRRRRRRRGGGRGRGPQQRLRTVAETSAGGVVFDQAHEHVVLIGRLDRTDSLLWSLPKGHIEEEETPEETAVREVKEETGISAQVLMPLGTIDFWFVADRKRIHKTVHHFLLEATGGALSDDDVEVTEVAWVPVADLNNRLAYADERKLARQAIKLLRSSSADQEHG